MKYKACIFIFGVLGLVVTGYAGLCMAVKHVLSPSQFARFGRVVVKAAVLHTDEGGASRAVQLAREAVRQGQTGKTIALSGVPWSNSLFTFTLPGYAISLPETNGRMHKFPTFSTDAELGEYFYTQLPAEGWELVDRMGSLRTFKQNDVMLSVATTYYLTTGITELSVSLHATPI